MDGHTIRKRSGRRITALAVSISVGILLLGSALLYLSSDVRDAWLDYSTVSGDRTVALSELHRAIGYGGFIHNFKNYVLRRDSSLLNQLQRDIDKSLGAVDAYLSLELNSEEKAALTVIRGTFLLYSINTDLVHESLPLGLSIQEMDDMVRIDDTKALMAIATLQEETQRYNQTVSNVMNERIALLIDVLLLGLLSLPFVVLIAYHYHDVMNSFVTLTHEKKQVEKTLEDVEAVAAKAQEKHSELAYEANHCELTRVPNRKAFMAMGQVLLDKVKDQKACLTVLFVDVDDFKAINDTYGHHIGDSVLVEVAARLSTSLHEGDIVARIGGDEFAAILQCHEKHSQVEAVIERLFSRINLSYGKIDERLNVTCSVGGASYPEEAESLEDLIQMADQNMYRVKKSGKNGVYLPKA